MKMKKLIGMAIVFVVLASIALWQGRDRSPSLPEAVVLKVALLGDIDLNALTGLDVNEVSLEKIDGVWGVSSLQGYPVDFPRLADALRKLAEVELGQPVRSGNVDSAEFGLDAPKKNLVLKTGAQQVAAKIHVGARREASSGWANQFFVRTGDDVAVYLVDYDFRPFSDNPSEWISKELLRVPSTNVVSVSVGDVELKQDGAEWVLADLDSETEEFQSSEANRLRSALQYLNCETVAEPDVEFGTPTVYTAKTQDGLIYTVTLGNETEDGQLARIKVEAEDSDASEHVDQLNEKLSNWTYVISSYAAESLRLTRDQLVKPIEDAEETL